MSCYKVLLFYRFFQLNDLNDLREKIYILCSNRKLQGRILLADEGINGTLAGWDNTCDDIIKDFEHMDSRYCFIDWKLTIGHAATLPFPDLYIKVTKELIGTGLLGKDIFDKNQFSNDTYGGLDTQSTGIHITPEEWHHKLKAYFDHNQKNKNQNSIDNTSNNNENHHDSNVISPIPTNNHHKHASLSKTNKEKIILLDVRNDIEYQVGHFIGSTGLKTSTYAESWKRIDNLISKCDNDDNNTSRDNDSINMNTINCSHTEGFHASSSSSSSSTDNDDNTSSNNQTKIFMYCTGGIRCEKASAYLIKKGVDRERIFQLEGGIHRYLEQYPDGGIFEGKNYVFDQRVLTAPAEYSSSSSSGGHVNNDDVDHSSLMTPSSATSAATAICNSTSNNSISKSSSSNNNKISARCQYCETPYDNVSRDRVCCVCRHDVIVCDDCVQTDPYCCQGKEFHCELHSHLKDCYHNDLSRYTLSELQHQKQLLNQLILPLQGKKEKNRRRTLRNQIEKIEVYVSSFILLNQAL